MLCLGVLAGCGGEEDVDWSQHGQGLKTRIDNLGDAKDCDGLQEQFDIADGNGSADLMEYIDKTMRSAGCY